MITQTFDLNLIPDSAPVVVHVNQYDIGAGRLIATLYKGETAYTPASGATAQIQGTKPDGRGFEYSATLSGSTVTADVTDQMSIVAGPVRCQIVVQEGDNVTGTFAFILDVQKSALPADTDMSASEYQLVEELLQTIIDASTNPPYIGANGNWWVWSVEQDQYVDSGVDASITVSIADITMLEPGATPYVTNTGTDTDPVFHLYIPRGATGAKGDTGAAAGFGTPTATIDNNTGTPSVEISASGPNTAKVFDFAFHNLKGDTGAKGDTGLGIKNVTINASNHLIVTYTDNTTEDTGSVNNGVTSFNGRSGSVLPVAGDYDATQINYAAQQTVKQKIDALVTKDQAIQNQLNAQTGITGVRNWFDKDKKPTSTTASSTVATPTTTGVRITSTGSQGDNHNCKWLGDDFNILPNTSYQVVSDVVVTKGNALIQIMGSNNNSNWTLLGESGWVYTSQKIKFSFNSGNYAYFRISLFAQVGSEGTGDITYNNLMISLASDPDDTYVPYAMTNRELTESKMAYADNSVLGAKNFLKITADSQTINDVTFTVNRDSNGNVLNVTVNGKATDVTVFIMSTYTYAQGEYILSGCPSGGHSGTSYAQQIRDTNNATIINDEGNSKSGTLSGGVSYRAVIRIANGYTANNLVFYPMLRLASDPDDTYVPHAMTNKELTEKKIDAELTFVTGVSVDTLIANKRYYCSGGMTGLPTGNIGYLDVHRNPAGDGIHQTFYPAGTQGEIYVRRYWDNAWGSWYKFTGTVVS